MKKLILTLLAFLPVLAHSQVFERTYIATDRYDYIAGDRVWCSAFCFDNSGVLSQCSSIAYLQLLSPEGSVANAKISLVSGRGSGYLDLPENLPNGNYSLVAFTAVNKNEQGYDFLQNAKTISIFNPQSSKRIKNCIEPVAPEEFAIQRSAINNSQLEVQAAVNCYCSAQNDILIKNNGNKAVSVSVSVWHDDSLLNTIPGGISDFICSKEHGEYIKIKEPETDGEIIYAQLSGPDTDKVFDPHSYVTAYISTIGCENDIYTVMIGQKKELMFKTYNIYGNKDMVCEVDGEAPELEAHMELDTPFLDLKSDNTEKLTLHPQMEAAILERFKSAQAFRRHFADSLMELLPRKEQILLSSDDCRSFNLDDYTRFPTMEEVLVEITPNLRVRWQKGKANIQVFAKSATSAQSNWGKALVLLDGVPIFDQNKLMEFDAMLIKKISVWARPLFIGNNFYEGIANFETNAGNISYIDFSRNVRIIDFKGASYPMSFTKRFNRNAQKDLRQTVYWHPEIEIGKGESIKLECLLPDYPGTFRIKIEGVNQDGSALFYSSGFNVQ